MSSEKKSIGEIRKEFENVQKEAQTEKQQKAFHACVSHKSSFLHVFSNARLSSQ